MTQQKGHFLRIGNGGETVFSVAKRFVPSPIQELSLLAQRCNAINLAKGYPDFPAPLTLKNAAVSAINSDFNQYRHVQGICDELAKIVKKTHGLSIDPLTDIVICCGQTEAFATAVFSVIYPGDEVIIFNPSFNIYANVISIAGGVPVYVNLDPPKWSLDPNKLLKSFTHRTKAIVLNSPHNPTGKVFSKDELDVIAGACCANNCLAITDEHISLASLPGMQRRTIITSSLSKTFSVTGYNLGWRVGWAIAPAFIASAMRNIHVRITDSAPAPFQEAALIALQSPQKYFKSLRQDYESKRDFIVKLLVDIGFLVQFEPQGSVFVFVELPKTCTLTDVECVEELIKRAGVVAVPGRGFFSNEFVEREARRGRLQLSQ